MKVGAEAARRACTRASKRGDRGGEGVLGGLAACERVWDKDGDPLLPPDDGVRGPTCVVPPSPPGFVPRRTEGWACLWHGGKPGPRTPRLWLQAPSSGGSLQPGQGDGQSLVPACPWLVSHHPNHHRLRGALRKGVHP